MRHTFNRPHRRSRILPTGSGATLRLASGERCDRRPEPCVWAATGNRNPADLSRPLQGPGACPTGPSSGRRLRVFRSKVRPLRDEEAMTRSGGIFIGRQTGGHRCAASGGLVVLPPSSQKTVRVILARCQRCCSHRSPSSGGVRFWSRRGWKTRTVLKGLTVNGHRPALDGWARGTTARVSGCLMTDVPRGTRGCFHRFG